MIKSVPKLIISSFMAFSASLLLFAQISEATHVKHCKKSSQCSKDIPQCYCEMHLGAGQVGDQVVIMDENGKTVAKGNIISRAGSTGHVLISEKSATIRSRYPGIVSTDGKNSNLEWTAMFSYGSN